MGDGVFQVVDKMMDLLGRDSAIVVADVHKFRVRAGRLASTSPWRGLLLRARVLVCLEERVRTLLPGGSAIGPWLAPAQYTTNLMANSRQHGLSNRYRGRGHI